MREQRFKEKVLVKTTTSLGIGKKVLKVEF